MVSVIGILNFMVKCLETLWHFILVIFIKSKKSQLPSTTDITLVQSATSLAKNIALKKLKSEDILRTYIRRIEKVNPIINAICDERFKDALEDAKLVDNFTAATSKPVEDILKDTPFLGVPVTIKNMVALKGLVMDAGVLHRKGDIAEKDSEVVRLLRKSGAIPLLVSNVPESCMWIDSSNKLYGRTLNPYDLTKSPGGSSGGEGALIGSACSVIGVGTDIGGSIRIPSFSCGIFGHKPTKNIVSNKGNLFETENSELGMYKVTGPMCRYAEDLLPMLKVMAGENIISLKLDEKVDVKSLQFYYVDSFSDENLISAISPEMLQSVKKVTDYFDQICFNKCKPLSFNVSQGQHDSIFMTKLTEATHFDFVKELTGESYEEFSLASEVFKFIFGRSKHTFHLLVYLAARQQASKSSPELIDKNNESLDDLERYLKETLGPNGVIVMPSQPQPQYYHQETLFKAKGACYTSIFNMLGYPVTQCPIGLSSDGLPNGVQIVSLKHNDHYTLAVAKEIEKGFGGWQCP